MATYKLVLLIAFGWGISVCSMAQENNVENIFRELHRPGEIYPIFTNEANVRPAPNIDGKVMDVLYAGDSVTIMEKTSYTHSLKGMTAFWLKISYTKEGKQKEGYLWQGLLSPTSVLEGDIRFVHGIQRIYRSTNGWKWVMQLKAVRQGNVVAVAEWESLPFRWIGRDIHNGKSLNNVTHMLVISYGGESCGMAVYDHYFAWNGQNFYQFPALMSVPDGSFTASEEWVFPDDVDGQPGQVIQKKITRNGIMVTDNYNHLYFLENYSLKSFSWDGRTLGKGVSLGASGKPVLVGYTRADTLSLYARADKESKMIGVLKLRESFSLADPPNYEEGYHPIEADWIKVRYNSKEQHNILTGWIYLPDNQQE